MQLMRENNTIIKKRKINLNKLENYDEEKIKKATKCLQNIISNSFVSHFNNISYFLGKTSTFSNNTTGCISECKKLKKELNALGLKTYFISCKANGFSNPAGDFFVKEAHVFLLYPSLKNKKVYFTIFDPGFRLEYPISFYDLHNSESIPYLSNGIAEVRFNSKSEYPYEYKVNKRINYKHQISKANIQWEFNPYYQTLNIDQFSEQLYHAIFSLKLMNYPDDLDKYICIRAKIIDNVVEVYTIRKSKIFSFNELSSLTKEELENIFKPYFEHTNLISKQLYEFIENLFLMIHNAQEYINKVINNNVIEEYKYGKKLNR